MSGAIGVARWIAAVAVALTHGWSATAAQPVGSPAARQTEVLFQDVRVFDGTRDFLSPPVNVLIRGNRIAHISGSPIPMDPSTSRRVIAGGGRSLMPGLIDAHWHIGLADAGSPSLLLNADPAYMAIRAARQAEATLMRGFTSVRDMGGPFTFGVKRAVDEGRLDGPRIWPSGAGISQTGGHGEWRSPNELPAPSGAAPTYQERIHAAIIADSPDEVRKRVREQLMLGASQLKLMAGGGVTSNFDPLDVTQYGEAELRAAVEAAENWGTYVAIHAYTPRAIQNGIRAGVKSIEHGMLLDEETARMMAEKGVWLSLQPFLDDEDAPPLPEGSANRAKYLEMAKGTDNAYLLAKKYRLKTAWGADFAFNADVDERHGAWLTKLTRWYTPAEVLRMATANNAELLALSGPRSPYPGKLGVVEEGALADLLLVDGDPLANLRLLEDPEVHLRLIMRDGRIYKDTLDN